MVNQPVHALIFAMSEEKGIEYHETHLKSIDKHKFSDYLVNLHKRNPFDRIAIFADNITFRKTELVRTKFNEQNIPLIFNVPY